MPTDRNKVSAYLSDQDFALLGELAAQHRVSKSQMVALAIRYMSGDNTPTNTVTNPTGNFPIESKVSGASEVTVESLVESKLVELLSNPTIEVRAKLEAILKEFVRNGISKVTNSTVKALDKSQVSEVIDNGSKVITETSNDSEVIGNSSKVTIPEKTPSENALEVPSNEIKVLEAIEEDKPDEEAKSEDKPYLLKKPGVTRCENLGQT